jgi:hypothetical protein
MCLLLLLLLSLDLSSLLLTGQITSSTQRNIEALDK